ncbi:LINE-1 retrotransposable element ORF2 protein [Smittium culicis]|uniref:LINE-1 retrotransposable element ORF2 protein n=1 Tax=Smittium culicis TaxID=133412 RepID=A0A1R1YPF2_9FUNG|nr:LINE-1 retrotransposable element ORF2 protein [Smittium culicis]
MFTWVAHNGKCVAELDHILVSKSKSEKYMDIWIEPGKTSDHLQVITKIQYRKKFIYLEKTNKLWKLNPFILNDPNVSTKIEEIISELVSKNPTSKNWSDFKGNLKESLIIAGRKKALEKKIKLEKLEIELVQAMNMDITLANALIEQSEPTMNQPTLIYVMSKKIKDFKSKEVESRIGISRGKWFEEGEKSNSYFYGTVKIKENISHIKRLNSDIKGVETRDKDEILNMITKFYSKLFYSGETDKLSQENILSNVKNSLELADTLELSKPISYTEIEGVVSNSKSKSFPGIDGITFEFYKKLIRKISKY